MSTSQDIVNELLGIFATEAEDHLRSINRGLLALEEAGVDASGAVVQELFRAAHSLKGAARAVNLPDVESLAHDLEDLFARLQDSGAVPQPEVIQQAYRNVDELQALVEAATREPASDENGKPDKSPDGGGGPPRPTVSTVPSSPEETVRIGTAKLDAIIAQLGELVVSRLGTEQRLSDVRDLEAALARWENEWRRAGGQPGADVTDGSAQEVRRLTEVRRGVARLREALDSDARRMAQVTSDLEADVRRTRLLPLARILDLVPRMVRDLAMTRGKDVGLTMEGQATEVDRSLLEQLKDPILHLVRNCVDHGIESPPDRAAAGKSTTGTISISARRRGGNLIVEVADDGAGIDASRVRRHALERGLLSDEDAAELSEHELVSLIFRPGLSTADIVTELSGRGVGLDAVRDAVERLSGSISVDTRLGEGTVFSLTLPVAVSTLHSVLLDAGGQTFALPGVSIERILRVSHQDVVPAQGGHAVIVDNAPVLLVSLADVLGIPESSDGDRSTHPAVVVSSQDRRVALLADRVTKAGEVVTKKLPEPLSGARHVAGATILGSGQAVVILSPADLISSVELHKGGRASRLEPVERVRRRIVLAEDSITTRTLEKNILESAGYSVVAAKDGAEAWGFLESEGCDLVVADVEMPRMDGFTLTARIRSDPRYRELPVVLVTSRSSREDRERGVRAGADAYLVKGAFDQARLLETIEKLL